MIFHESPHGAAYKQFHSIPQHVELRVHKGKPQLKEGEEWITRAEWERRHRS